MKKTETPLLIVVLICGSVAAILSGRWLFAAKTERPEELVEVIVAKTDLPVGTRLDEKAIADGVTRAMFRKSDVPKDLIDDVNQLKGMMLNRTLKAGSWFLRVDLFREAVIKLPEGMVLHTVRCFTKCQPGDWVDSEFTGVSPEGEPLSEILVKHRKIMAIDMRRGPMGEIEMSATLAVTQQESLVLADAEKRGKVRFLLRDSHPD